jgi:hypothetical protein
MNVMVRALPVAVALVALFFSGIVHGLWTNRWESSGAPAAAAARLPGIALNLGEWRGEDVPMDADLGKGVSGSLCRRYVNRKNEAVTMVLVCGRPAAVVIHTPDICYKASGFEFTPPSKYRLPQTAEGPAAEFWHADFSRKRAAEQTYLRIFWSWNARDSWSVPENQRVTFAGESVLYRLYLIREMTLPGEPLEEDPCLGLMRQLLPELQKELFAQG